MRQSELFILISFIDRDAAGLSSTGKRTVKGDDEGNEWSDFSVLAPPSGGPKLPSISLNEGEMEGNASIKEGETDEFDDWEDVGDS